MRGHHGYVAAPPSRHKSGKQYRFAIDPRAVKVADCPDWIVNQHKQVAAKRAGEGHGQGRAIESGGRNQTLTAYGGKLRKMGVGYKGIVASLMTINQSQCVPPLRAAEVQRIAQSVSGYKPGDLPRQQASTLQVKVLSEYTPEKVEWLWPNWIPRGEITLVMGDPGIGKSWLSLFIAAKVTTGQTWPEAEDGPPAPVGEVLLMAQEDDPARTILPRFLSMGGDPSKVHLIESVLTTHPDGTQKSKLLQINEHMEIVEAHLIQHPEVQLVVIDPITSYLGRKVDANNYNEVQSVLATDQPGSGAFIRAHLSIQKARSTTERPRRSDMQKIGCRSGIKRP